MKNLPKLFVVALICFSFSSCEVIGGIFKAGVGVGIFIVVAILVVIGIIVAKSKK